MYQIGQRIRITVTFRNEAGTPTSPSTVTGTLTLPDGTTSALAMSGSAGVHTAEVVATQAGRHYVRVVGSGTVDAAAVGGFVVDRGGA